MVGIEVECGVYFVCWQLEQWFFDFVVQGMQVGL